MQGHFKASISILLFTDHRCILLQPLQTGADVQQAAWNAFTTSSKVRGFVQPGSSASICRQASPSSLIAARSSRQNLWRSVIISTAACSCSGRTLLGFIDRCGHSLSPCSLPLWLEPTSSRRVFSYLRLIARGVISQTAKSDDRMVSTQSKTKLFIANLTRFCFWLWRNIAMHIVKTPRGHFVKQRL
jgi:hypothetical protein